MAFESLHWRVIRERPVYRDRWVEVAWADVTLPDGSVYRYTTLRRVPGAAVVALDDEGRLLLQQQYRYPLRKVIYQLPGGLVDPGETPLETARRELLEETGYEAEVWEVLGVVQDNPGLIDGPTTLFLARKLRRVAEPRQDSTEQHVLVWHPLSWLRVQVRLGRIEDRVVLAALTFLWARGS